MLINCQQNFNSWLALIWKIAILCTERIFPSFRFVQSVVGYFLRRVVFPREMNGFPYKLSASGWDIGEVKRHPLTGLSGTNDSREVLPLSLEQLELPTQMHTNALVLGTYYNEKIQLYVFHGGTKNIDQMPRHCCHWSCKWLRLHKSSLMLGPKCWN